MGEVGNMARLAIIGAGPKGVAIAAKAAALRTANYSPPPPDIDLYDHSGVGAAWGGTNGYTDGVQPLCTLAERDLGFPYDTAIYGPAVAQAMIGDFSWQSFAIGSCGRSRYRDWVVNGRHPPRHIEFADYLGYAVKRAVDLNAAQLIEGKVLAIGFDEAAGKWRIDSAHSNGEAYDGVVITGTGRPHRPLSGANGRVFDARTFWQPASQKEMLRLLELDPDRTVVIIGAGGAAAAVAYWFVRTGLTTVPITIIGREATLFARHNGPFEDRLFANDEAWTVLPPDVRDTFLTRTTSGVVWDYVLRNLVSDNITYECHTADCYRTRAPLDPLPDEPDAPDELAVEMKLPDPAQAKTLTGLWRRWVEFVLPQLGHPSFQGIQIPGTVIVDARGFDRWGFVNDFFAGSPMQTFFDGEARHGDIESDIGYDLSVQATTDNGEKFPPGLHVPALGAMQGPASTNLMGLGWLADRILSTYLLRQ